mgnify:CR=1 FL=1
MDLYNALWDYLNGIPTIRDWPELNDFLRKVVAGKPRHWRLVARACQAAGGTPEQALPGMAALGALFLNIVLIDDMLDQDPKGQYHRLGHAATANIASAFQAAGYEAIARSPLPPLAQAQIYQRLTAMLLQTTLGQYWDSHNPSDEASYWQVTRAKSSPYFATSFYVGVRMAGGDHELAARVAEVGALYGEMIQINDDLNDVMETPANVDWLQGRYPLPILFATLVPHPERERFLEVRTQIADEAALIEAQEILIRCGAMSFGVDQLLQRYQQATAHLDACALAQPGYLQQILDEVVAPAQRLLAQLTGADAAAV